MSGLGIFAIRGISPSVGSVSTPGLGEASGTAGGPSFADLLQNAIRSASKTENDAQNVIARSLTDENMSEIEVLSAVKKADLSMRLMLQVRNSLLQAYDEIKQMQF